jgi:hypothetical protein
MRVDSPSVRTDGARLDKRETADGKNARVFFATVLTDFGEMRFTLHSVQDRKR